MVPVDNTLEQHQEGECVMISKFFYGIGYVVFFVYGLLAVIGEILKDIWDYVSMSLIAVCTFFLRRMYKKGGDKVETKDKLIIFLVSVLFLSIERKEGYLPQIAVQTQNNLLKIPKAGTLFWAEGVLLVERWL